MNTAIQLTRAAVGATMLTVLSSSIIVPCAAAPRGEDCVAAAPTEKPKKGVGLSGLLGAAKRAGVGNVLGAGVLGGSRGAQIAGAVAGTAVAVTDSGSPMGALASVAVSGRTAQAVSAAAGTAVELARQVPSSCATAN